MNKTIHELKNTKYKIRSIKRDQWMRKDKKTFTQFKLMAGTFTLNDILLMGFNQTEQGDFELHDN